jgi:hypothetical protein
MWVTDYDTCNVTLRFLRDLIMCSLIEAIYMLLEGVVRCLSNLDSQILVTLE